MLQEGLGMGNLPYMGGAAVRTNVSRPPVTCSLIPAPAQPALCYIILFPHPPSLPSCCPRRRVHIQRVAPLRAHPLAPRDGANHLPPLPHPVLLRRAGKTGCALRVVVRQPALALMDSKTTLLCCFSHDGRPAARRRRNAHRAQRRRHEAAAGESRHAPALSP